MTDYEIRQRDAYWVLWNFSRCNRTWDFSQNWCTTWWDIMCR